MVIMAMPTLFGDPSVLREQGGLRLPGWPPGLFFSCSGGGARRLFRRDPTSLSTSTDTGHRGASDRKPDDNARAKCGARERRQDQNHDPPLNLPPRHQFPLNGGGPEIWMFPAIPASRSSSFSLYNLRSLPRIIG
jgi:hypothetical protein